MGASNSRLGTQRHPPPQLVSTILQSLHLAPSTEETSPYGLVSVKDDVLVPLSIPEKIAQREARFLEGRRNDKNIGIDYIYFRRFNDQRSSQVAAYILDNSSGQYEQEQIAELHRRVWLNGTAPLLYVEWPTRLDVLKCAAEPVFWDSHTKSTRYKASASIDAASEISKVLDPEKSNRFSAYRLSSGTFWDAPENMDWAQADKAAHKSLIRAVIDTDNALDGSQNPLMRRLLLLTILSKYLEDRGVFPSGWFEQFSKEATGFQDVLKSGEAKNVREMLEALREKFNGDIFNIESSIHSSLTRESLNKFITLLEANVIGKQMYLWKIYSFNYIPVEVLSHLYQHFAQSGNGAVFTPPFVADLMLDHALPFEKMNGDESILDPTCGSGIFLVGAFRRLVHLWQSQNEWKRPGVPVLKAILRKSIFGTELSPEAAQVASFNLAIAMCDALQPKVIWKDLRFDKLIDQNLYVGDFFEQLPTLRSRVPNGFTTVVGNPPFLSKLTKAAIETRTPEKKKIPIPDGQMAYRIAEEAMSLLCLNGCMCLVESAGFLYNAKARTFLADFISSHTVETILDFVSIRNLFEGADPKTIAIVARAVTPSPNHNIVHQTFRRTKSVHDRIGFELDHYDHHIVEQQTAVDTAWIWKANLLGGGRLQTLGQRAKNGTNLKRFCRDQGWDYGEGFIAAKSGKRDPAPWLTGKPYLPTECLQVNGIVGETATVGATEFRSAYSKKRYSGPIVMIRANEKLPCIYRSSGFLAYRAKIIGVSSEEKNKDLLKSFFDSIIQNRETLRFFLYLFSTQMLVGKSTALLKRDIDELPSPVSGFFKRLSWWEKILISDVLDYFSDMVRTGQNSALSRNKVDQNSLINYSDTFSKLLKTVYSNIKRGKSGSFNGLAYQAFYFGKHNELDWPEDWSDKLEQVVFKRNATALQTVRVVRFYEENALIIIKPDRLRHWIASTAIRDADETLLDLQQQGF